MTQYVYWHAPLWEVLLVAAAAVALLAWLIIRILRRTNLTTALAAVKPELKDQPLFSFDFFAVNGECVQGERQSPAGELVFHDADTFPLVR
jgi:hypothetical protein